MGSRSELFFCNALTHDIHDGITTKGQPKRMFLDVVDLRDFYASRAGQRTRRRLRAKSRLIWPRVDGMSVLGVGFPTPVLGVFRDEATRLIAAMPAPQGVMHWPDGRPNAALLTDETHLPLPDRSIDRVILMHALEDTARPNVLLREVWRVLADSGRVLAIVPNRSGIWARVERSPFAHGRPYTAGQISRLLRDSLFTPLGVERALFTPPTGSRFLTALSRPLDHYGPRWLPALAGVLMVEASKQLYATPTAVVGERVKAPQRATQPSRFD